MKIEKRPLMLVEAEYEGVTIRTLTSEDAKQSDLSKTMAIQALSVELKIGDKVMVYLE